MLPLPRHMRDGDVDATGADECATEFPSIGSYGHFHGSCKPCAFLHNKGCENGFNCPFCHLCDAGEKKKRSKEKQALRKDAREGRKQNNIPWVSRLSGRVAVAMPTGR